MIPKFTEEEYLSAPRGKKLPCECKTCKEVFYVEKRYVKRFYNHPENKRNTLDYCSIECHYKSKFKQEIIICTQCKKEFLKNPKADKRCKTINRFCSSSCAATYNNQHKTHGTIRSKLEIWLETQLPVLYPNIEFHFNRKDTINSELDIYIPSLSLAFELNGIFHYEPIHGKDKLNQIQNNDNRKFQACLENNIELVLIDSSKQIYFKESGCKKYLDIITNIINQKLLI
jgi:endo-alpha-1,4-polygalactosaminidase (GH114 family)